MEILAAKLQQLVIAVTLVFLINVAEGVDINSCQTLNTANTFYNLTQNVSSVGTCFTISANNITLECRGNYVTYGNTAGTMGNGLYLNAYSNLTVNNCTFQQGAGNINKIAIYIQNGTNNTIQNSNITSTSGNAVSIVWNTSYNNLVNNSIIVSYQRTAIYLNNSQNNTFSFDNITNGNAGGAYGVYLYNDSVNNTVYADTINSTNDSAVRIEGVTSGSNYNNVSNNTLTDYLAASPVVFLSNANYNNVTSNKLNSTNGGIYLYVYSSNNNVSYNNVTEGYWAGNYGIYLENNANNNLFLGNVVGSSDYAVYVNQPSSNNNNFSSNSFNATQGYAVRISYADSTYVWNNSIQTGINATTLLGVYLYEATNTFMTQNYIVQRSATNGYGIQVVSSSNGNTIYNNTINVSAGQGIYAGTSASSNNFSSNIINATTAGIRFGQTAASSVIDSNNISTTNGYGIGIYASSNNNNITNNNLTVQTYGIQTSSSSGNNFTNNTIGSRTNHGIEMSGGGANNDYFGNNTVTTNGSAYALYTSLDSGDTFYGNTFTSTLGYSVYLSTATSMLFDRNTIYASALNGQIGVYSTTSSYWNNFTNNNITSLTSYAVLLTADSSYNKFSNNWIFNNNSHGASIQSASTNNVFDNNTIQGGINSGYYPVYIDSSNYNNFTNDNISSRSLANGNDFAIYITNGNAAFNYFENDTVFSNNGYGIYLVSTAYNNSFKNVSVKSNNTFGVRISTAAKNNTFDLMNITSVASYPVYMDSTTSTNNTFTNSYFQNYFTPSTQYILYMSQASNNIFKNVTITAPNNLNARGIAFTGSGGIGANNNKFYNSSITAPGTNGYDVYSDVSSKNYFLNVSFNTLDTYFNDLPSSLNLSWYLNISVTDGNGALIPYTNVTVVDQNGMVAFNGSTDAFGYITPFGVTQYVQSGGGSINYSTPYNITASKGSSWGTIQQAVTTNTNASLTLGVSTCGSASSNVSLNNDVYAGSTCFTVTANSVNINCNGHAINFSRGGTGYGVNVTGKQNVSINNCTFFQGNSSANSVGVFLYNASNTTIANSTFNTINANHLYLNYSNDTMVIGTSFNSSLISLVNSSTMFVRWYEDVKVQDYSNNIVENANVSLYNASGTLSGQGMTNGSGSIPTQLITQYVQRDAGITYATNYSINASSGSISNSTTLNITSNTLSIVTLNVTTCGNLASNYTLTNNLYSNSGCFNVTANSVVLSCNGYSINYSRSGTGYAINVSSFNNFTAANCTIIQGASNQLSHAIFLNGSVNTTIANSSIGVMNADSLYSQASNSTAFVNTTFDNSSVFIDSSSNMTASWYLSIHVIGLANEDVGNANVTINDSSGSIAYTALAASNGITIPLLREYVRANSTSTYSSPYGVLVTHPNTLATNYTTVTLVNTTGITLQVVSAAINITTPYENQIFFAGDTVAITINVTKGQAWVTNATLNLSGSSINAYAQPTNNNNNSWSYNYVIDPSTIGQVVTITGRGYNGTTFVTATRNFVITQPSGAGVASPVMNQVCSNLTYQLQNKNTTINASAKLGTIIFSMTANVTYPDNTSVLLASSSNTANATTYTYSYYFPINVTQTGRYTINATVKDVNNQQASKTAYLYGVAANQTMQLNGSGITSINVRDQCSNALIASGLPIRNSLPSGNYTIEVNTTYPFVTFYNLSLTNAVKQIMSFSSVDHNSLTPPANRRAIQLFSLSNDSTTNYSSVNVLYNYSADKYSLVAEASLEIDYCLSLGACSWNLLASILNTSVTTINANSTILDGIYGVFEPAYPTPQVQTNTQYVCPGGQIVSSVSLCPTTTTTLPAPVTIQQGVPVQVEHQTQVEKQVNTYVAARVLNAPGEVEIHQNESKEVSIELRNTESIDYKDITLEASVDVPSITPALKDNNFALLQSGGRTGTTLVLSTSGSTPVGNYTLTLKAKIGNLGVNEEVDVPVRVLEFTSQEKLDAQKEIQFASSLLSDNQECLEYTSTIGRATELLGENKVTDAKLLAEKVVNGCKKTIGLLKKDVSPLSGLVVGKVSSENPLFYAVFGVIATFILIIGYRMVKPKRYY